MTATEENTQNPYYPQILPTHHRGISKPFNGLKDATTNGSHGEGTTTVIHYSPGAKEKNTH